jgi:myo-inositol-1-phosphate synthase
VAGRTVRVGIVGVGNCASALTQGLVYYGNGGANAAPVGLISPTIDGLDVEDIEIVSAFDVADGKVGRDLAEAITAAPNNTLAFASVPEAGVSVARGPTLDGLGRFLAEEISESEQPVADVTSILCRTGTEVLVNYLPVGAEAATRFYAECALEAGCAFVNCIPVFLASDRDWARRFTERGLPIIGDDVKSQVGATIVHRWLAELMEQRGLRIDRTSQLNVGGNTDFLNMLERERLVSKKISKTRAVTSRVAGQLAPRDVHIGPSDHVPWLDDRKWAYIRIEGTGFGGAPVSMELKLEVWDSPNSAGVVIDAIRCAKLGLERGLAGPLDAPSSAFMKSPPEQLSDWVAHERLKAFVAGTTGASAAEEPRFG